jgi:L-ascorbate metabolism protein UlaG (beta-lactamase superfamily)
MNAIKKRGKYYNLSSIKMSMSVNKVKKMTQDYFSKENSIPPFILPRHTIDKEAFEAEDTFVWLGHSTILGNIHGVRFIVDPMLHHRASPFKCLGPKRFDGSLTPIEELPDIDVILITHNHYDHLDEQTIKALQSRVQAIYVPLDNASILEKWGIEPAKIREFDWFEEVSFRDVTFAFAPTQHFSGRGLTDRDNYLWGSWVIKGFSHSLYVSGDSGYHEHFKRIGEKYGEFDVACVECGAYNSSWSEIHMMPEESVQASIDLKAKVMLPMHWAGFDLSTHAWDEPISRAMDEAKRLKVTTTTPMIGQVMPLATPVSKEVWWRDIESQRNQA